MIKTPEDERRELREQIADQTRQFIEAGNKVIEIPRGVTAENLGLLSPVKQKQLASHKRGATAAKNRFCFRSPSKKAV